MISYLWGRSSDETKRYNGWSNYETWCVHLWLTNEEGSYRYWREEAERYRKEAPRHQNVREEIWSVELAERAELAKQMRNEIEETSPLVACSPFPGPGIMGIMGTCVQ
jgi:hypothetical protein